MKSLILLSTLVFSFLTAAQPVWAQDASTSRTAAPTEDVPTQLSALPMRLNPQIGVSSFSYSGNSSAGHQKFSGGATVEFGGRARKLETGLLLIQTGADATLNDGTSTQVRNSFLTIPMMAKIRLVSLPSQAWYAKFGVMSAFSVSSNNRANSNSMDILGSVGAGGRFGFSSSADFLVEATYNRGFLDAIRSTSSTNYNQGVLVLAGLSFRI